MKLDKNENELTGSIQVSGHTKLVGGVTRNHGINIDIPKHFTSEEIKGMGRDCEILGKIFRENPEQSEALFNAFVENRSRDVRQILDKIGLREETFAAKGGGLVMLVAGAVVLGILLYASDAY